MKPHDDCLNLSYTFLMFTEGILFEAGFAPSPININYLHRIQVIIQWNSVIKLAMHVYPPAIVL